MLKKAYPKMHEAFTEYLKTDDYELFAVNTLEK